MSNNNTNNVYDSIYDPYSDLNNNDHKSPFSISRSAHPGAVLLSPQPLNAGISNNSSHSNSNSIQSIYSPNPNNTNNNSAPYNTFFNQQQGLSSGTSMNNSNIQQPIPIASYNTNAASTSYHSNTNVSNLAPAGSGIMSPTIQSPSSKSQNVTPNIFGGTHDIYQLCSWISNLTTQQQNSVMDNILSSLNEDVLHYTKLKIDTLTSNGFTSPQINVQPSVGISISPPVLQSNNDTTNLDSYFLGSSAYDEQDNSTLRSTIHQPWSPQPISKTSSLFDYSKFQLQRPKSADPHLGSANINQHTMSKRGMAKTLNTNGNANNSNSLNKTTYQSSYQDSSSQFNHNSSSTPASASSNPSMNPKNLTDPKLLTNVPMWLKSLRLHKYSDNLKDLKWIELIYLNDEILELKGVAALGARRKLLKAFQIVKEYNESGLIDRSAYV
ncbi:hypothetical protein KAFR_0C05030 [Kazachstania africana CBS 2517]|uniref:RNA-binding protein VTS1 n=1 Tax=Kazachstania africana (strain ATCC 22294 / BCRC 22015 / CBS 2517 / CECT 1963 / NBRC 1671 / NRRL Y-8276) TaxID=1071382 RepID=H2ASZ4_KAZAF|nr:hypothetical protein KAFR_0C05030 [Kazachstania africana CBS 2517]CCF57494.1 hypothetical protein KAFR_0C05030 [Kazachstania africana CBS 2517]